MNELYKQEITELTELLNVDEEWDDLRSILIQAGIDLSTIILVSFMEDDEENEYGVIVSKDLKVSKYIRKTQIEKNNIDNFEIVDITNEKDEIDKYPQVSVAIDMIKREEIL